MQIRLTISRSGDTFTGTFESNVRDDAGTVLFTVRGTTAGTRIVI